MQAKGSVVAPPASGTSPGKEIGFRPVKGRTFLAPGSVHLGSIQTGLKLLFLLS